MVYVNYFYAYVLAFGGIVLNGFLYLQFIANDFILTPMVYLIILFGLFIMQRYAFINYLPLIRKYKIIMSLNYILTGLLIFCSWIYFTWSFGFVGGEVIAKIVLTLLSMMLTYIYVMTERAIYSASKKLKNPRINETKKQTYFERIREADKKLTSDKPYFVLGVDINTEIDDE